MDIIHHKTSIMSFFIILFKCSEISFFEIQVCSHDRANASAWGLQWTWVSPCPSTILTSSQAASIPWILFNDLFPSIRSSPPHLFQKQCVIVSKFFPFVNFPSPLPVSYHHFSPVFHGQISRKISQHSISLFPHLLSSTYCIWFLLSPRYKTSPLTWLMIYVLVKFNS